MKTGFLFLFLLLYGACTRVDKPDGRSGKTPDEIRPDSLFRSVGFRPEQRYAPVSLSYRGKPLLSPGEHVSALPDSFSFRPDPNGPYRDQFELAGDYLSTDDDFVIPLKHGAAVAILYFSADQAEKRIFQLSAFWTMDAGLSPQDQKRVQQQLTEKLFPGLKGQPVFEPGWAFELDRGNYRESFRMPGFDPKGTFRRFEYRILF